jgi:hypothetical protein
MGRNYLPINPLIACMAFVPYFYTPCSGFYRHLQVFTGFVGLRTSEPYIGVSVAGIKEVADEAGVSTATVSRALRGLQHVNESTRLKIH